MEYKIFGCKVNKYYTDEWLACDYLRDKEGIFVASCVVTDNAKRKWIKFVKDTAKDLPKKQKIYISGCGAITDGEAQTDFFEIYPELLSLADSIEILKERPEDDKRNQSNISQIQEKINNFPRIHTKKFLLIQGGCDSFCTFCLTVKKRGRHYSRSADDIINDILAFEAEGGKEVVLTGVNLTAWGLSSTNQVGDSRFAELLGMILEKTSIPRIKISSLGPEFVTHEVLEHFKNHRITPHFHYSVQSGSSKILKSMARHYDGDYMRDLLVKTKNIKREDGVEISIGADLIIGFPGESQKDFLETYNLIKDGLITKVHAFPFSAHTLGESVAAGSFPHQIDEAIKKERMWEINSIADHTRDTFIERNIGKNFQVLIEFVKEESGMITWKGWTENYIEADQNTFEIISGKIERNQIVLGKLK